MSGHRLRSVRSSPYLGEVRVYAELSLSLNKKMRGEGRTAYGTERSGRSASERMFAECAEPSGAKWRSCGDGAELPYAKRCALRRLMAQCAFERSGFLATLSRAKRSTMTDAGQPQEGAPLPCCGCSATSCGALRSSLTCGEVRVYAELVLSIIMRGPGTTATGTEWSERSGTKQV